MSDNSLQSYYKEECLTLEQHKRRLENLRRADKDIKSCTREMRIFDYLPGQAIYWLGEYPNPMSIEPTEYDYNLLKSYAENGVDMIQVHEEWNDALEKFGGTKYTSSDHKGMLKFVDLCHEFGIKIIPYCSSSFVDVRSKDFTPDFLRTPTSKEGFINLFSNYRFGSAESAAWREYIIPRTFNIMDTYGFDGIFNDWGYDWENCSYKDVPPEKRNYEKAPLERYNPEAEDLVHTLYEGVKRRGGIYKLHIARFQTPPVRGKFYDYLWVGECCFSHEYGVCKMYEPYVVPCPDKPRLTNWGEEKFDADAYFAATIPFVQFPLLTHGRPMTGKLVDVPGVEYFRMDEKNNLYDYYSKIKSYTDSHPDGPYTYSEWSQIPDDIEDYPRWCKYLALYKPMVKDGTVVHMEIKETEAVLSPMIKDVFFSLFTNDEEYMAVSNMTDAPYKLVLRDEWIDRETDKPGKEFTIPKKRIIFLKRK